MNLFNRKKYIAIPNQPVRPDLPDGMWVKCDKCEKTIYSRQLGEFMVCPGCDHHFRIGAPKMIELVADADSFIEEDVDLSPSNPIGFPDYERKIAQLQKSLDVNEAVIWGKCAIEGIDTIICAMDNRFIMGSMGSIVGEKITRAFEAATAAALPIVIFTCSGGARMQEGIISLMQMAKVSAAAKRHSDAGLLYVTILTDPTTGGVTASFAMLGDVILAEPGALVGFAGRRVIEQTIKQSLPADFQSAEFVLEHGFIDKIVSRQNLRKTLGQILTSHTQNPGAFAETPDFAPYTSHRDISPGGAVEIARKINRPTSLDIINAITTDFIEFHGDRNFRDDPAIVGGIAKLEGIPITVIATQKGINLDDNMRRNFGQPHPEGYRKALRLMRQAEKFGRPILTLINTSGAYPATGAEERGQGEAIARNLLEFAGLTVPTIAVIVGEGGSGGALALAATDRVYMFEYAIYSILSPEGFAGILWRDGKRAAEAAEIMKLRAIDLLELGIIEGIIPEPPNGFQDDQASTLAHLRALLIHDFAKLSAQPAADLLNARYARFRKFGE